MIKVGIPLLTIRDGAFYEGGEPVFLFGAECHYFRIDPVDWRERLLQVKAAGCNLISTYVPWLWHEPGEGDFDFVGATHPRRNLTQFLELCRELGFYVIVRPGPYVMSELRREGIPEWVLRDYPEVIARTVDGASHPTRVVSYLHPTFLKLAESWYHAVLTAMLPYMSDRGGPIVVVQLDNEIGMLHWVTNGADFHPVTLERYERFLQQKPAAIPLMSSSAREQAAAGIVEAVTEIAQVEPIADHEFHALSQHFLWSEFCREDIAEYVSFLEHTARRVGVSVPFLINVHGFKDFSVYSRGTEYPIGVSQLRTAAGRSGALVAGDFYPGHITYDNFHDVIVSTLFTAAISSPDQPIFSAEFQSGRLTDRPTVSGRDLDLLTRLCIAHGMNALNYYMFCAGDNPEDIGLFGARHEWQAPIASDGALRPAYAAASHLGSLLSGVGRDLCSAPKLIDTHVAFYSPYYMTETAWPQSGDVSDLLAYFAFQREHFHFDGLWRLLAAANISFAALDLYGRERIDPAAVPSLWVAATAYMDRATQATLLQYVSDGGCLIVGPGIPEYDLDGSACRILADALNAHPIEQRGGYRLVNLAGTASVFCRQHLVFDQTAPDEVWGWEEGDASAVVAYVHPVGKGRALVLGVGVTHEYEYQVALIRDIAAKLDIVPEVQCAHPHALATLRRGPRGSFLSVVNVDEEDLHTTVTIGGQPAFDGIAIRVAARSGVLLPVNYRLADELRIDYCTAEVHVEQAGSEEVRLTLHACQQPATLSLSGPWTVASCSADFAWDASGRRLTVAIPCDGSPDAQEARIVLTKNRIV